MPQALYCTELEVYSVGINRGAIEDEPGKKLEEAIRLASAYMDGFLAQRYVLPLTKINDPSLAANCAQIAAYYVMRGIGFNPENGSDQLLVQGWKDANAWLDKVVANRVSPQVTDSTQAATPGQTTAPRIISGRGRGYSARQTNRGPGGFLGD